MNNKLKYILVIIFLILVYFYTQYNPKVYKFDSKKKGTNLFILGSVHGNEPAGTVSCYKLIELLKEKKITVKNGSITILPLPNPLGYYLNSRFQLRPFNRDINRNFLNKGKDRISKIILKYVNKSDFIIDLHEGWGFNRINKESIGSTLSYTQFNLAKKISKFMIESINKTISNENHKFNLLTKKNKNCLPKGSLGCYSQKNKKNYILIETTGQDNIQKLEFRVKQDLILLKTAMKKLNII